MTPGQDRVSPLLSIASVIALSLAAQAGCLLLLLLSRFGQNPFPSLPLPTILMFGALFASALLPPLRRLRGSDLGAALALAALANAALAWGLPQLSDASPLHALAPAAALALALLYRPAREPRGTMLAAMTVYTVCTVLANYTFDSFIPLGDFFLVNVGTLFFGITFTQRDRVHRFGRRAVYAMIVSAAFANVAMALHLGTPLRYVAVGFLAILLSETADTEIYQRLLSRRWLVRVASSNAVSAPLDTLVFTTLAFAGEPFATSGWMMQVIVTDVVVKYASSMVAALRLFGRHPVAAD